MNLLTPFRGIRPGPGSEARILAPPYDVLNSEEARERARENPDCFLHVSKAEIDFPPGTDPTSQAVYTQAGNNFRRFLEGGLLIQDESPCFYLYRLTMDSHVQTGVVGAASMDAYRQGRIKKHENTQPKKLTDRIRHMEALEAQTGPVFMIYRRSEAVDLMVHRITSQPPVSQTRADHGVVHALWVVEDDASVSSLQDAFEKVEHIYIADGHHRSEAASQVAHRNSDLPFAHRMLSVHFPDDQVHIWDYNRVVKDLHGRSPETFLETLGSCFTVTPQESAQRPRHPGEFSMYLAGSWYGLRYEGTLPEQDAVGRLDISVLSEHVIKPLLNIHDQRNDPRIDFIGGRRGLGELQQRVDSGEMALAFAIRPPSLEDLMVVADAGSMMPTKSTWFEPKLADGMVSLSLRA